MDEGINTEGVIKPTLDLTRVDGNAFFIMAAVRHALKQAGNSAAIIDRYTEQAKSGNYDHLLQVSMAHVKHPDAQGDDDSEWGPVEDDEKRIVTKLTRLQAWRVIAYDTHCLEGSKECMRILEAGTPVTISSQYDIQLSRHKASITGEAEYWLTAPGPMSVQLAQVAAAGLDDRWQEVPDLSEPLEDIDVEELVRDTLGCVETNLEECRRFLLIATTKEHRRVLAGLESALIVVQAYAQSELGIKP